MSFIRHSLRSNTVMSWSGRRATNNTVDVRNYSRFYRGNLSVLTGSNYNTIVGPNSSSTTRNTTFKALAVPPHGVLTTTTTTRSSSLSTTPTPEDPQAQFKARPPSELTMEMAEGIQNANHLIVRYGVGAQRLKLLAQDGTMPLILKWQRMMEIYLGAQLHVIAALGYEPNEHGIMLYTQHLAQFITNKCEPSKQDTFRAVGRDTWRHMLVTAFDLDIAMIKEKYGEEMSIVDARNTVHKVASKLIEPRILDMVATKVAQIPPQQDPQMDMGMKHAVIQDLVVNHVYLGGDPPLVEELGFGTGPKGYALMQYVMAYHENDPLCMQYTSSSMVKIWQAAGLDLSNVNGGGGGLARMPMSIPS